MSEHQSWFAEPSMAGFQQRFVLKDRLFRQVSRYQTIDIYDTVPFGRMLALNGAAQTTENDEFIYHEMLTLVPMLTHPHPRRVAIVGGGDGGSLRRVLQSPSIEAAFQLELDPEVTAACKQYLPAISAGAFDEPRAHTHFGDGAQFLRETQERFDVVLVDSTDPIGPAEVLFSEVFYRDAYAAMSDDGILVTQSGSPLLMANELRQALININSVFPLVRVYLASIPSYPGVLWSFILASKGPDPLDVSHTALQQRLDSLSEQPAYYTADVHFASFALPRFLKVSQTSDNTNGNNHDIFPS